MITKVKVWIADKNHKNAGEVRIYVDFSDRQLAGCYYKTGNFFNSKGSLENMSASDLAEARSLALVETESGRRWQNWSAAAPAVAFRDSYAAQLRAEAREDEAVKWRLLGSRNSEA